MGIVQNDVRVARVGIAEGMIVKYPDHIRTTGLGSCVGVVIFDKIAGFVGMVHVMLPIAPTTGEVLNQTKYADTAIYWLVHELLARGCTERNLRAKIAGGAQMFAVVMKNDLMRVGPRNVEAVHAELSTRNIPIITQDVGGNVGRTIEFDPLTESLMIRTALRGVYAI